MRISLFEEKLVSDFIVYTYIKKEKNELKLNAVIY